MVAIPKLVTAVVTAAEVTTASEDALLEESFGGPVMEAMAIGVPVVAAREAAGCRFLLDDGGCGRLASGRSPDDIARALAVTWTTKDETARLVELAQRRVRVMCDPGVVLSAYEDCYAHVVGRA